MERALSFDGTITLELGGGPSHEGLAAELLGAKGMAPAQRIKDTLDPEGILSPGAVFSRYGARRARPIATDT